MLQGSRQCGKTYILTEFSKTYPCSIIVNLEYDDVSECFESVNADKIYEELSFKGIKIVDSPMSVDENGISHLSFFVPCLFDLLELSGFNKFDMNVLKRALSD